MAKLKLIVPLLFLFANGIMMAQKAAIKTNILSDALLNVNVGVEFAVEPRFTVDMPIEFNGWTLGNDHRWKHWSVQPGLRRWFCDRFGGHFVGVHAHGGQFNVGGIDNVISFLGTDFSRLSDSRFQGWFVGAGLSYGYAWILGKHWNLEAEIGLGYSFVRYDRFRCAGCGKKVESGKTHHYVGPTKAAVNLVYLF